MAAGSGERSLPCADRGTNSELSVAPVLPYRVTTSAPTLKRTTTALVDVTADGIGSN